MSDEKFNPQESDGLTNLITERLAERQYIIGRIQDMQNRKSKIIRFTGAFALVAAACVAVILVFHPFTTVAPLDEAGISQPSMSSYRSASEDIAAIETLMSKPDYVAALAKTKKALTHLDMQIDQFKDLPVDYYDEEMQYEEQNERMMDSELRWTYIYLLTKQGQTKEAIKQLKLYLKNKEYAEHSAEAKKLLNVLKENS